jgi:hypothetical protein
MPWRLAYVTSEGGELQQPPRTRGANSLPFSNSRQYSQRLPSVSYSPNALGFFSPPLCVRSWLFPLCQATSSSDAGAAAGSPARAAYSHSDSVGRR